jgi:hypothetical protein
MIGSFKELRQGDRLSDQFSRRAQWRKNLGYKLSQGVAQVSRNGTLANYRRRQGLTMMGISNNTEWYHLKKPFTGSPGVGVMLPVLI